VARPHFVMVIDLQACIGCSTCAVACKQENNLPEGVWWCQVVQVEAENGNGQNGGNGASPAPLDFLPLGCQHCEEALCIEVCPTSAAYRDPALGVIMQDPNLCIGCRYCMMVCPYTGVRVYASENLSYSLAFPSGGNPVLHRPKTVEKCTFCAHRLAQGLEPACVTVCPVDARVFGDLNNPDSRVSELLRTRPHFQLLREKGVRPSVYYLT
jgi:dimethyl sulfoxide reductase iron-sulfur subunit